MFISFSYMIKRYGKNISKKDQQLAISLKLSKA